MSAWSRYLFGTSIVFGVGTILFTEHLPHWCGPVSILVMVLAASAFLVCSVLGYRRECTAISTSEERLSLYVR